VAALQGSNATRATTAGGTTYVGLTFLLALLNGLSDPDLRTGLPGWVEVFLAPLLPALVTTIGGYLSSEPRTRTRKH